MYDEFVMCRYCKHAEALAHSQVQVLCSKRGVVEANNKCGKFDLNLLSIQPPAKKRDLNEKQSKFTSADFSIE